MQPIKRRDLWLAGVIPLLVFNLVSRFVEGIFALWEGVSALEQGKIGYAIRLPANRVIQEQIQPLLERPTEWPSREPSAWRPLGFP